MSHVFIQFHISSKDQRTWRWAVVYCSAHTIEYTWHWSPRQSRQLSIRNNTAFHNTSHDGKQAETKKLLIGLTSLVFGHISNHSLLNITRNPYKTIATKYLHQASHNNG